MRENLQLHLEGLSFEESTAFENELQKQTVDLLMSVPFMRASHAALIDGLGISTHQLPSYWNAISRLINSGKLIRGRGKGGSVRLNAAPEPQLPVGTHQVLKPRFPEIELYRPILESLRQWWIPQEELQDHILEITANQGKRSSGFWSRPDIISLGATCFPYLPGRNLDVTTFEVKKSIADGIAGVYETAAHSVFAHRSFLVMQAPLEIPLDERENFDRIQSECERFRLGLITFNDASDWQTFETVVEAEFNSPSPAQINKFIANQISEESQKKILMMFR